MLKKKYQSKLQALIMSGFMSFVVSGIITYINLGMIETFIQRWFHAWIIAYSISFPSLLIISPIAVKISFIIASKEQ
ncbi:MAG: DUF2798 domain-containing protein [Sulfuricurvum sp.]|nr:DUF2798 domain-containing protein [Sulfuricurvum sp.]